MINRDSEVSEDQLCPVISQEPLLADENLNSIQADLKDNSDQKLHEQPAPESKPKSQRLHSLDAYRGLTVLGMILADQTYDIDGAFWLLIHPKWNGLTLADLVFPAFLFIMGMAIPLATSKTRPIRAKNIIRVFALFGIGLFLNIISQEFDFPNRNRDYIQ